MDRISGTFLWLKQRHFDWEGSRKISRLAPLKVTRYSKGWGDKIGVYNDEDPRHRRPTELRPCISYELSGYVQYTLDMWNLHGTEKIGSI